jgi:glycosyltransferase involved in cell wall biosynthesis/predicted metal-dependent phosphoesterase TrpH
VASLGVQNALGLPECATPPEEVYELARRRGMDFVTITDHDTIDGALEIAHLPGAFVSVELTAAFPGEESLVHVLCWDITPGDHDWLQAHRGNLFECAEYLASEGIACALAHPFYSVGAPLTASHRRVLAEMFPVWETRNGSRAEELNRPAGVYIETRGGTGVGGSDDHAGVDIGRTWTETPLSSTPAAFLAHVMAGQAEAGGEHGSAEKWAHAALALAARTLGVSGGAGAADPAKALALIGRFMREASNRGQVAGGEFEAIDAAGLLHAHLEAAGHEVGSAADVTASLQDDDRSHADLFRRACRRHERRLGEAVDQALSALEQGSSPLVAAPALFDAALPVLPYLPAVAFLGGEKHRLNGRSGGPPRVALVADGLGSVHGVKRTLDEVRERGVPGYEVEVVGVDQDVDRRLPAVREFDVPFYPGLRVGVPPMTAVAEILAEGRYDVVHVSSPGPCGIAAAAFARLAGMPLVGSHHTELSRYAAERTGRPDLEGTVESAMAAFYGACAPVMSPSREADEGLAAIGVDPGLLMRWERGVDTDRFRPDHARSGLPPAQGCRVNVMYSGRLTREKGCDLMVDAFLAARARDDRLHLVLAGGGPEEETIRERLGQHATFLGWLEGDELPAAYALADVFLFASRTDTFGQVILEAQACGVPVVAVGEGGPASLVGHRRSGLLCRPEADELAGAILEIVGSPPLAAGLRAGGLAAVAGRSWGSSMAQLAAGYDRALAAGEGAGTLSAPAESDLLAQALGATA